MITPNMFAITVRFKEEPFIFRVYFKENPTEIERELIKEVTSEIASDFNELNVIQEEIIVSNGTDKNFYCLDEWIFRCFDGKKI